MNLETARTIAQGVVEQLKSCCRRIEIAGSIRREKPEVKDIEICIIPEPRKAFELVSVVNRWHKIKGEPTGKYTQRRLPEGINLDLFIANENNWGLIFAIRTGSANFSHKVLASSWVRKGYCSENGILYPIKFNSGATDKKDCIDYDNPIYIKEEKDLFDLLGLKYIEPKFRE